MRKWRNAHDPYPVEDPVCTVGEGEFLSFSVQDLLVDPMVRYSHFQIVTTGNIWKYKMVGMTRDY